MTENETVFVGGAMLPIRNILKIIVQFNIQLNNGTFDVNKPLPMYIDKTLMDHR